MKKMNIFLKCQLVKNDCSETIDMVLKRPLAEPKLNWPNLYLLIVLKKDNLLYWKHSKIIP